MSKSSYTLPVELRGGFDAQKTELLVQTGPERSFKSFCAREEVKIACRRKDYLCFCRPYKLQTDAQGQQSEQTIYSLDALRRSWRDWARRELSHEGFFLNSLFGEPLLSTLAIGVFNCSARWNTPPSPPPKCHAWTCPKSGLYSKKRRGEIHKPGSFN